MDCLIAIGGNQGPVIEHARQALRNLREARVLTDLRMSGWYRTEAVGDAARADFFNAVVEARTDLEPLRLLDELQRQEQIAGRLREVDWGPRTLDLDLVMCGEIRMQSTRLILPHPECWYRRFVLDPIVEQCPALLHPERGVTFQELRTRLLSRPLRVLLVGGTKSNRERLAGQVQTAFDPAEVLLVCDQKQPAGVRSLVDEFAMIAWLGPTAGLAWEDLPRLNRQDLTRSRFPPDDCLRYCVDAMLGANIKRMVHS